MKYLGTGSVKLSQLKVSGKFRERLESSRVKDGAESMKIVGQLQQILVRKRDSTLIAGEDRVAKLTLAGAEEALCNWWEATDLEVAYLRRMENAERRHDVAERDKSLLEMREAEKKMAIETGVATTEKEAEIVANDKIAKEREVKPGSEERRARRAKKRLKDAEAKEAPVVAGQQVQDDVPESFSTHGIELGEEFGKDMARAEGWLRSVENELNNALHELSSMMKGGTVIRLARLEHLHERISELVKDVRGVIPASVCLYCKCVPDISAKCVACDGNQFLMQDQLPAMDKRLLDMDTQWVVFEGKMTLLSDLADDGDSQPTVELPVIDDGEEAVDEEDLF